MMDRASRHLLETAGLGTGHGGQGTCPAAMAAARPPEGSRDAAICNLYRAGETLSSIGAAFELSIEGVRKIARRYGLDKTNAGLAVRKLSSPRPCKSKPAWERVYGCSLLAFRDATYEERMAYLQHRTNAKRKGLVWALSLTEWTSLWRSSGKWSLRGQGPRKYGMTRIDPARGLVPGNARIAKNAVSLRRAQTHQAARKQVAPKSSTMPGPGTVQPFPAR